MGPPSDRTSAAIAAAEAACRAADWAEARGRLEEAGDPAALPPDSRAAAAHVEGWLARAGFADPGTARARLVEAADTVADTAPDDAVLLLLGAWALGVLVGLDATELSRLATRAEKAAAAAGPAGAFPVIGRLPALAARAVAGDRGAAEELGGSLVGVALEPPASEVTPVVSGLALTALHCGAFDAARECIVTFVDRIRGEAPLSLLAGPLTALSACAFATGDWTTAVVAAAESARVAGVTNQPAILARAEACRAPVEALLGRDDSVRASLDRAAAATALPGGHPATAAWRHFGAGLYAAALGRWGTAVEHLAALRAFAEAHGPCGLVRWEGEYLEALVRTGRADEAVDWLRTLDARPALEREPWLDLVKARARVLLGWRESRPPSPAPGPDGGAALGFETARLELCVAERFLAAGRLVEGREHLDAARAGFEKVGAAAWVLACGRLTDGTAMVPAPPGRADGPAPELVCSLFRRFRVSVGGRPASLPGLSGRLVALLALADGALAIDEVVEKLWPEVDFDVGRARLRKILWRVRGVHPDLVVRVGENGLSLGPDVAVDVRRFSRLAAEAVTATDPARRREAARAAAAACTGDVLPELPYEQWAIGPRERCRRQHVTMLDLLADDAEGRGDPAEAVALLEQAVARDRYDEARYLRCAELLLRLGRRGRAAELVEEARRAMDALGVGLSEAGRILAARLRAGR